MKRYKFKHQPRLHVGQRWDKHGLYRRRVTVHGYIRVTEKLTSPSDVRAKTDLREVRSLPGCLLYVRLLCNEIDENKQRERRDYYTAERINSSKAKRKLFANKDTCFIGLYFDTTCWLQYMYGCVSGS